VLPDGGNPVELLEYWGPWVQDCLRIVDGDGTYARFKYAGGMADQPAVDLAIYDVIRTKWNALRNQEMRSQWQTE